MITYSFIIPHKNNPDLLQRCVNSIPRRDDIQIIVVDDNSDKMDWNTFKFDDDKCIELIKTHDNKGAGYARNIGLEYVTGKWILFADCDDFYYDGFLDILDKYKNLDIDVLYFNFKGIYSDSHEIYPRYNKTTKYYSDFDNTLDTLDKIRYKITMPWNKMINSKFLKRFDIRFEEVMKGNDLLFSFLVGFFSKKVAVETQPLYAWTLQKQSSISNTVLTRLDCQIMAQRRVRNNYFYCYIGKKSYKKSLFKRILSEIKYRGIRSAFLYLWIYLTSQKVLKKTESYYIKLIEKKIIQNEQKQN